MNLIKVFIASIRWGELSPYDVELVEFSTLKQVFRASYLRRSASSPHNIIVLEK